MEVRDASGTVLFTMGFDALIPAEAHGDQPQAVAEAPTNEDGIYAYDKAA